MTTKHPTSTMLEEVRALLEQRDQSLEEIAIGADLSPAWVASVSCGRARNPTISRLERLRAYLIARRTQGVG